MAKKKSGVSKSQSIRDHLQANPGDMPKQIIAALAKQGIKVSNGLVAKVKYTKKTTGKKEGGEANGETEAARRLRRSLGVAGRS